jgi:hypothetical protein
VRPFLRCLSRLLAGGLAEMLGWSSQGRSRAGERAMRDPPERGRQVLGGFRMRRSGCGRGRRAAARHAAANDPGRRDGGCTVPGGREAGARARRREQRHRIAGSGPRTTDDEGRIIRAPGLRQPLGGAARGVQLGLGIGRYAFSRIAHRLVEVIGEIGAVDPQRM